MKSLRLFRLIQFVAAVVFFGVGAYFGLFLAMRLTPSDFDPFQPSKGTAIKLFAWTLPITFGLLGYFLIIWWEIKPKRLDSRICVKCGYDLRSTPDCCPECGTIPSDDQKKQIKDIFTRSN